MGYSQEAEGEAGGEGLSGGGVSRSRAFLLSFENFSPAFLSGEPATVSQGVVSFLLIDRDQQIIKKN